MNKKLEGHPISKVDPGSIGEELELEPGDRVLTINGNPVEDIFDYEYYVNSPSMTMVVRKANGEEWELDIENDYRTMRAELQSNIRNPLSCIKTSCFLINSLAEKENIQSEKLQEYLQIIETAAEDIESALK
mgnify:CR=1 FL=1